MINHKRYKSLRLNSNFIQNGRSAEDFQKNPSLLPFNQLISDFGISKEAAQEMLSDKGKIKLREL